MFTHLSMKLVNTSANNCLALTPIMFYGIGLFAVGFPLFGLLIILLMILNKLNYIAKSNNLLLAYLVNPESMLEATNSDVVVNNAMKKAKQFKSESEQFLEFVKQIKPLI